MPSLPEITERVLEHSRLREDVSRHWDESIQPRLEDYIRVPSKSPAFDADWARNGLLMHVVQQALEWARLQNLPDLELEVVQLPGRTPLLYFALPGDAPSGSEAVLFYGHLDKQPEIDGWRRGLGPWTPVFDGTRLYGRGGADDGYALYAALNALLALRAQGITLPRCVGIIETCEESGSYDLPPYLDALRERIGSVGLVACLDSGAGSYEQLWVVTSLRGLVSGTLEVQVLDEGAHSGDAGGIVPSSFRVLRHVLDRLEDSATGRLLPASLHCEVPSERAEQTRQAAAILGDRAWARFGWHVEEGQTMLPVSTDPEQALLNRAWRPSLAVTGAEGLPPLRAGGNVLRPRTAFRLSMRLPPLVDPAQAVATVQAVLEDSPPYQARVRFHPDKVAVRGWSAPASAPWLLSALDAASNAHFGAPCAFIGQGGTIPLMDILQRGFPNAQFMVCGVQGPMANAHGPNEFLHVPYVKRLTACVAQVVAAFATRDPRRVMPLSECVCRFPNGYASAG